MKHRPLRRRSLVVAIATWFVVLNGFATPAPGRARLAPLGEDFPPVGGLYEGEGHFSSTISTNCPTPGPMFTLPFNYCELTGGEQGTFSGFFQQMNAAGPQWRIYDVAGAVSEDGEMSGTAKLKLLEYSPDFFYPATFSGNISGDEHRMISLRFVSTEVPVDGRVFCGVTIDLVVEELQLGNCEIGVDGPQVLEFEPAGGTQTFMVSAASDCRWAAVSNVSWATVSPATGTGNGSVTVTAARIPAENECQHRTGLVTIRTRTAQRGIVIQQRGFYYAQCECPANQADTVARRGPDALDTARRFRDEVLARTDRGRRYTDLYYDFAGETTAILESNPWLLVRAARLLDSHTPAIRSILDNGGASISEADLAEIDAFLADVAASASPGLQGVIDEARRDLGSQDVRGEYGLRVRPDAGPPHARSAGDDDLLFRTFAGMGSLRPPEIVAVAARAREYLRASRNHSGELLALLAADPTLALRAPGALGRVTSAIESVVRTGSATMDEPARRELDAFLSRLEPDASPALRRAIVDVRRDLRSLRALEGFGVRTPPAQAKPDAASRKAADAVERLPLAFVARPGSPTKSATYSAHGLGYGLSISPTETTVGLVRDARAARLRLRLLEANPSATASAGDAMPGARNFFVGRDPASWLTNASAWSQVTYRGVYPGVDVVYYGSERRLEHDFLVAPHADPSRIRLRAEGVDAIRIDERGDLVLPTSAGEVRMRRPVAYQTVSGSRQSVEASYELVGRGDIALRLGAYDPALPLVVDPVLDYATYLGGSDPDMCTKVAVDAAGNIYLTGATSGTGFPVAGGAQGTFGGGDTDAYVVKLNPTGSAIIYATYLGGSGNELGSGLAVDASGNLYVSGMTTSTNFPTVSALQVAPRGRHEAFLARFNAAGSALTLATYLGGSGDDAAAGVALSGKFVYLTGTTASADFPVSRKGYSRTLRGATDTFVVKLKKNATKIAYGTFFGGAGLEMAADLAVDSSGNAYVSGMTSSADMPTSRPIQSALRGTFDGFVLKLDKKGSALVYATYLGGSDVDGCAGIAVDATGSAYVTGVTASGDFPVASPLQSGYAGGLLDGFVAKLRADGSGLVYSSYLGGSDEDRAYRIAVDGEGRAHLTGLTASSDFPVRNAVQGQLQGEGFDAFVTSIEPTGTSLLSSTYLGGSGDDAGVSVAVTGAGTVYVVGETSSTDFPSTGALQESNAGAVDAFVVRLGGQSGT